MPSTNICSSTRWLVTKKRLNADDVSTKLKSRETGNPRPALPGRGFPVGLIGDEGALHKTTERGKNVRFVSGWRRREARRQMDIRQSPGA